MPFRLHVRAILAVFAALLLLQMTGCSGPTSAGGGGGGGVSSDGPRRIEGVAALDGPAAFSIVKARLADGTVLEDYGIVDSNGAYSGPAPKLTPLPALIYTEIDGRELAAVVTGELSADTTTLHLNAVSTLTARLLVTGNAGQSAVTGTAGGLALASRADKLEAQSALDELVLGDDLAASLFESRAGTQARGALSGPPDFVGAMLESIASEAFEEGSSATDFLAGILEEGSFPVFNRAGFWARSAAILWHDGTGTAALEVLADGVGPGALASVRAMETAQPSAPLDADAAKLYWNAVAALAVTTAAYVESPDLDGAAAAIVWTLEALAGDLSSAALLESDPESTAAMTRLKSAARQAAWLAVHARVDLEIGAEPASAEDSNLLATLVAGHFDAALALAQTQSDASLEGLAGSALPELDAAFAALGAEAAAALNAETGLAAWLASLPPVRPAAFVERPLP